MNFEVLLRQSKKKKKPKTMGIFEVGLNAFYDVAMVMQVREWNVVV